LQFIAEVLLRPVYMGCSSVMSSVSLSYTPPCWRYWLCEQKSE